MEGRNITIDILKLIASFGVIAIHVHTDTPGAENINSFFSYWCVSYFFISSLYFFSPEKDLTPEASLLKICKRILIPFLVWTAIYLTLLYAKSVLFHKPFTQDLVYAFTYGQSAAHLYFLPKLIGMQLIILSCVWLSKKEYRVMAFGLLILAVAYFVYANEMDIFGFNGAWSGYANILSIILISIGVKKYSYLLNGNTFILAGSILLFAAGLFACYMNVGNICIIIPVGGLSIMLLALSYPIKTSNKFIALLASASYGIYLSHILFLEAFEVITKIIFGEPLIYDFYTKLCVVGLIFIASAVFTLIIQKISWARKIVLGEK